MEGKRIVLGVSGGIAAYKAAALTSKLIQSGAEVRVIMTESATKFITPLTFQALSRNHVYTDTFLEEDPTVISHIDVADWADLIIVAPATANTIGKLANGLGDDMLTTTLLATTAPVWIAPAMNVHMYDNKAVQRNIMTLYNDGYRFIEPSAGYLACGYIGRGRLEEPEKIVELVKEHFTPKKEQLLVGEKIVITAGPTRENVDPVRFFSNRSTGKMGYALAQAAKDLGADVTLISGPTNLTPPTGVTFVEVESAANMLDAVMNVFNDASVVIKSAAVADYHPKVTFGQKMKKKDGDLAIEMERTTDILKTLGQKKDGQLLVGFAAETEHVEEYAMKKLQTKNADLIVANNISTEGAGFGGDTNIVTLFYKDGHHQDLPLLSKKDVSERIMNEVVNLLKERSK
ncbi:bifunctional phosphopantothenoylcysteine decarboxylase/phosphopantothenate--cysteine ligase CoaBC [Priestia endophytica]|uniref:Coenzyme A biosynthesis bifunctional protein CoaBC n=1 Tax=Priestia endophytica DSM 13796 TaxID=1121089 RepID=A0A1I5VQQ5_9BACI|nr:bifunctional phosphopantothenoylcysteine decarboxylase/phosphopantothenate--cysteine ligase CoaBC [Priestia endophytica]KYG35814.1 phosphopantothenoylcysteine decarboxylase [Priestia endophytica]MED4070281.1 bifunctional phosphopantothenoylcysteine decarboxylase/phosphopantothenate--cysteine ligase CoaBC [Priestia endophytica]RAS79834.1 bifunctional 4'-phosphopantothenoylcysteine decarboxylase/phosphopantothenoylcysteine synthetase [Priestia endophytica]RAS88468.1 bifunctional 4'-phosphopant